MSRQTSVIYPSLTYRDPTVAAAWLERAFGFETILAVPGPDGLIVHAELRLGAGVIMLGGASRERGWSSSRDLPGVSQTVYAYIEDLDTHYQQAQEAGAEITEGLHDTEYGSREYAARDLEGHHWFFGTYKPGEP